MLTSVQIQPCNHTDTQYNNNSHQQQQLNEMWFVRNDPCGIVSALLTIVLLLYSQIVVVTSVLLSWYTIYSIHSILYTIITLLAIYSHCRCQFTNPGAIPYRAPEFRMLPNNHQYISATNNTSGSTDSDSNEFIQYQTRICKRCKSQKPTKAHHCSTCQRCITRMDHVCLIIL